SYNFVATGVEAIQKNKMNDYISATDASQIASAAAKAVRARKKVYYAAGTTDLYVQLKEGILAEPNVFIDIRGAAELKKISKSAGAVSIGSLTTFSEIIESALCRKNLPLLVEAAKTIGSPLIRNRATVGGNIANSSPAGDSLPALVALDASLVLRRGSAMRKVAAADFITGPKRNILEAGEFIESVRVPRSPSSPAASPPASKFSIFLKLGSRKALAISKVSLAVDAVVKNRLISSIRIAAGAVGPTVVRCRRTEDVLTGSSLGDESKIELAKKTLAEEILPIDDFRSTAEYRRAAAAALLEKALLRAADAPA
ncbi:MAG: FAD binding domain-containing protein, partial [Endomicrobiia bacterium]|nr:FAD binding domain-containing protein [Endomicrobiia bacterium]